MSLEPGAPAATGTVPLCVPDIGGNEWAYVKECLDTNWVSSVGAFVERFEAGLAGYVGSEHAVATSSGTAALHIALLVAGVEPDDEVLVPALSFIAPANAVRYCQAWPVFVDVEPDYWQMDVNKVERFLDEQCDASSDGPFNRASGRRVKAVLPVHALGHPVDMGPILELAKRHNLTVIEDATESLGATYRGHMAGHIGDIAAFSFNGNKLITTGGGGMIVTDKLEWADRARYLTTQAKDDAVEYVHDEIGYNYRLTNIQAAMGCAQLESIADRLAAKRATAEAYHSGLAGLDGITLPREATWASSAWWLYTILVNKAAFGQDSRELLRSLAAAGVQSRPLWQPLNRSRAHDGSQTDERRVAERLHRDALSLPSSVGLTSGEQERVIDAIKRVGAITARGSGEALSQGD